MTTPNTDGNWIIVPGTDDGGSFPLGSFADFRGLYYGPLATDPTLNPFGNPPVAGDMYFNTSANTLKVYSGTIWGAVGSGFVTSFNTRTGAVVLTSADVTTALSFIPLNPTNNLSELTNSATARTNLGLGTAATHATGDFLQTANNLSDVVASTARTNLGLGTAATHAATDFLLTANNLSDVVAATARTNLGLGTAAVVATGTSGATLGLLNANKTDSGNNTYSGASTVSGSLAVPTATVGTSTTAAASTAFVQAAIPNLALTKANNLSDLANSQTARTNLVAGMNQQTTTSFSGSSGPSITLPSGFASFHVVIRNLIASGNSALGVRFSFDNGSSYKSGASDYSAIQYYTNSAGVTAAAGSKTQTNIALNPTTLATGSTLFNTFEFDVFMPTNSSMLFSLLGRTVYSDNAANFTYAFIFGAMNVVYGVPTNLQIIPTTGTISGSIVAYGNP